DAPRRPHNAAHRQKVKPTLFFINSPIQSVRSSVRRGTRAEGLKQVRLPYVDACRCRRDVTGVNGQSGVPVGNKRETQLVRDRDVAVSCSGKQITIISQDEFDVPEELPGGERWYGDREGGQGSLNWQAYKQKMSKGNRRIHCNG
ncbi:unnamed protein product, partial [Callosobruchus maculatus]